MSEKVVYFHGCFTNYYNPDVGKALVSILKKNDIEIIVPEQKCCGMPMMANGAMEGAKKNFNFNIDHLAEAAAPGYPILTNCPSCNMMLKREGLPFFDSEKARFVSEHLIDAGEYLYNLHLQGRLNTNFREMPLKVFYHNACHFKVQNILEKPIALLKLIPGLEIVGVNTNCCGMGGSYGMKKINHKRSVEIAQKLWDGIKATDAEVAATECGGCGLQISAGTGMRVVHPLVLLNDAYVASDARKAA
jgi:glycerol-3-phosphate dehydrogenase subunit C